MYTDQDGYLVFSEIFYPGWRVRVDQEDVPILRANFMFSAVPLKSGAHLVERFYSPRSLRIGFIISMISGVVLVLQIFFFGRHSKRTQHLHQM